MNELNVMLFLSLLTALSCAQNTKDMDSWIKSIINTSSTPTNDPKPCGPQKVCVPRYQCSDGELNKSGEGLIDIRLYDNNDDGKCSFLEICCDINKKTSNPIIATNPRADQAGCGYRNSNGVGFRIVGEQNNESQFGEFPWMVAILKNKTTAGENEKIFECGGSLIAPTAVLSAAHCVLKNTADTLIARAGEWDAQSTLEILPHQDRRVREIIAHESFHPKSLFNDVALLIVERAFEFEDNVRPICLPPTDLTFDFARCYATGWGKDKHEKEGRYQVILKKVELPIMPRSTCQENLRQARVGRHFQLHESFICAGGEEGKDTCEGDGGSPLVCPIVGQTERFYQAGIVAWGLDCGIANIPGVYADVAHLRPWINEKLASKGLDTSHFTP